MKYSKIQVDNPNLQTWDALNEALKTADEKICEKLMKEERSGKARMAFIKRIHSRLNKVRADRERREMLSP